MIQQGDIEELSTQLIKKCKAKHITLTVAESCTGGLVASSIIEIPGASDIFDCGFITYSNESKQQILGVKAQTLQRYGAVSWQTASEMAMGALRRAPLAVASVATTGIAGPGGGSVDKPVGLVYLAICFRGMESQVKQILLHGDRRQIRLAATYNALQFLYDRGL